MEISTADIVDPSFKANYIIYKVNFYNNDINSDNKHNRYDIKFKDPGMD